MKKTRHPLIHKNLVVPKCTLQCNRTSNLYHFMPLHGQIKAVYGDYSEHSIKMKPNLNRFLNYMTFHHLQHCTCSVYNLNDNSGNTSKIFICLICICRQAGHSAMVSGKKILNEVQQCLILHTLPAGLRIAISQKLLSNSETTQLVPKFIGL